MRGDSTTDRQCFSYDLLGRLTEAWTSQATGCPHSGATPGAGPDPATVTAGPDGDGYWRSYTFDDTGNRRGMVDHDLTRDPTGALNTDPETGDTKAEPVTATIKGHGTKHLVRVTLNTDGDHGDATASVTATDGHPFWVPALHTWVPALHTWVPATDLHPGAWLRTSTGVRVQVTAVSRFTRVSDAHNLTVAHLHTYYVLAGETPVLVHNSRGGNLCPHPDAEGPHTSFRRDGTTGEIDHYETYDRPSDPRDPRPFVPTKRVDVKGKPHFDKQTKTRVPTPHVNLPDGSAIPAEPWEIPRRNS